jgi:acyl-ACP thioesterase
MLSPDELTLFAPFRVTSADTDMKARLRLGALVNMLIQSAIQSADSLGFGFSGLRREKLIWVLSRMTVEIQKTLYWNDEVVVETWPKDIDGLLYLRDYIVRNRKQEVVALATSGWLAIDMESRRPKNFEGINAEILNYLSTRHAIRELPEKLPGFEEGAIFERMSTYFDLDLNGHVTSTRYIDWMMDTQAVAFHRDHYPKRLSVNYMKETMPDERMQIRCSHTNNSQLIFEGTNVEKGTIAFRGKVDFQ